MQPEQIIKNQLEKAPLDLKKFISSKAWMEIISEIASRNNFSADIKEKIENEVLFILLGLEFKWDLEKNIEKNAGTSGPVTKNIANEIKLRILNTVDKYLPTDLSENELPGAINLIEDSAGNADNVLPEINTGGRSERVLQNTETIPKKPFDILDSQAEKTKTALEEKLSGLAKNENSGVVEKKYSGQDPYREPIN